MKYSLNQLNQFLSFWNNISSTGLQLEVDHSNNRIPYNKKGNKIHIKKENRGKFTEFCNGKVTSECILKGKNSSDPKIRKRATFAANARTWKHLLGGVIKTFKLLSKKLKPLKDNNFINNPYSRDLELHRILEKADGGRNFIQEWLKSPHFGERAEKYMTRLEAYKLGKFESSLLSTHNFPLGFRPLSTQLYIQKNGAAGDSFISHGHKAADRVLRIDPNNAVLPRYTGAHEAAHMSTLNYTPTNDWKVTRELFDEELRPLLDKQIKNALVLADQLKIDPKKYALSVLLVSQKRGITTLQAKDLIDNWIPYLKRELESRARGLAAIAYSKTNHTTKIPVEVDGGLGIFTDASLDNLYKNIFSVGIPIGVGLYATQN